MVSCWGELQTSILDSIFQSLSFQDVLRVQSVSSQWSSVSQALIASKSQAQSSRTPWLMLPPEEDKQEDTNGGCLICIDIADKRVREIDNNMLMELTAAEDSCCIGSSHGWLIFLDQKASPFLLNPFMQVKIQLPCLYSLLGIRKIDKNIELGEYYCIKYNKPNSSVYYTKHLRENVIYKGVLSSNPCLGVNNLGVVVIHGSARKLGYYNYGDGHDDSSWSGLDGKFWPYHDIICHKNKLYALGKNACVEAWDLDGCVPIKRMEIELCFPTKSTTMLKDFRYLYVCRLYLAENNGDWLLLVRYIGEFVDENNVVVSEEDLLTDEDTHPLVCPYKTLLFHVYKLDFDERRWIEVESLGDSTVFLGGSHSITVSSQCSVSGCRRNSIYFTDDYWERMEEDYLYGGHDMGVFNLEDQRVEPIYQVCPMKIQPPPCWVAPSLW